MGKAADYPMKTNILKLPIAPKSVPEFLRAAADELERDGGENLRCLLTIVSNEKDQFRIRINRHNFPMLEAVGALQCAMNDLLNQ